MGLWLCGAFEGRYGAIWWHVISDIHAWNPQLKSKTRLCYSPYLTMIPSIVSLFSIFFYVCSNLYYCLPSVALGLHCSFSYSLNYKDRMFIWYLSFIKTLIVIHFYLSNVFFACQFRYVVFSFSFNSKYFKISLLIFSLIY
jgi:hypothetical protein